MTDRSDGSAAFSQPMSKTEYVLARLRQELSDGTIHPGQQLRQVEIAERYGVSATPVREALRLLEADGTIRYSPHRGATVTELAPQEIEDLYLMRISTESLLARLAAERATPEEIAKVRDQHEDLASRVESASAEELSRLNREFHLSVLRLGSPLITEHVVTPLWHGFLPPSNSQWRSVERNTLFVEEHERIVEALEAGDPKAAEAAMSEHLRTAMKSREEDGDFEAD
ncbi:MAG TPA: GntR family transcriptional regulator [Acidimicrobiia bacterium]|nr:GntR family transcriptional regulator [Acidimicrobiia bacterium]